MSDMREGVCPKCGSSEVYYGSSATGQTGLIAISFWSFPIRMVFYVCTDCGYTESYIPEKKSLRDIAKKWQRADWQQVAGSKRKNDE
jgi:predicted nucleic-acid-binding Zn-ribbon protein